VKTPVFEEGDPGKGGGHGEISAVGERKISEVELTDLVTGPGSRL